jgi:mannose-6-phosphate isomerase-like protein (cupin superfamily)
MYKIEKVWGFEEVWVNEPEYCFKILALKPGFTSSLHYHLKKKETFLVLKGYCYLEVWRGDQIETHKLVSEDKITILPGQPHRFFLKEEIGVGFGELVTQPCIIYEISTHHDDSDVVRKSESRRI